MGEEVRVTRDKSGRTSAGILLWRSRNGRLEVLLAHQGGPFWVKKDIGHWTIPKGEVEPGEEFVAVARREFAEETGHQAPNHPLIDLGQIRGLHKGSILCCLCWRRSGSQPRVVARP
jgi:predicted NUDIX family NTP pyrophosphohydrolase